MIRSRKTNKNTNKNRSRSSRNSSRYGRKGVFLLVLAMLLTLGLSGCGKESVDSTGAEARSESAVFRFQGQDVTLGEVYLYALPVIEDYEKSYGKDIWNMTVTVGDDQKQDMKTVTRKDVIENIVKVKVLVSKAASYKVSLTVEEKQDAEDETEAFWKNLTDRQIAEMELTRDLVYKCMTENRLAAKVYDAIMEEAGIEISDEEARETTFYDLYFPTYKETANGTAKPMGDAEKSEQYDKAVQAYNSLITPMDENVTRDPAALATYYGLTNASYYTMTPEEVRDTYGKDIADMLYTLEDGSCSLVTETEYGYHIFYMKALTDRTATDKKKSRIERERRNSYFSTRFAGWLKDLDANYHYEDSVDFSVYDRIKF